MQAPQYPNPTETAQTQSTINKDTARSQQQLGMVNASTPLQATQFLEKGTWSDGTPRFESQSYFSPQVQGLVDANITRAGTPFSLGNEATESRLMELGRNRLDPILDRRRESTKQSLFNAGARPGSEAYRRGEEAVTQGENDAYNELLLTGRSQAASESLAERNQPFNEFASLLSGSQIQAPGFSAAGVAPVDYTGQVANDYASRYKNYADTWSGIGNLAGAVGGWAFSDERLKTDERKDGETADGIPVKTFRF